VVESGGTAIGSVLSGGSETVTGSSDFGAVISSGEQLNYGFAGGATIFKGSQTVQGGGIASGSSSTQLLVSSGGLAEAATISSGGSEIVSEGGSDLGAAISGGKQLDSGFAGGATVFAGSQVVQSGGTASSTSVHSGRGRAGFLRRPCTDDNDFDRRHHRVRRHGYRQFRHADGHERRLGRGSDRFFWQLHDIEFPHHLGDQRHGRNLRPAPRFNRIARIRMHE